MLKSVNLNAKENQARKLSSRLAAKLTGKISKTVTQL